MCWGFFKATLCPSFFSLFYFSYFVKYSPCLALYDYSILPNTFWPFNVICMYSWIILKLQVSSLRCYFVFVAPPPYHPYGIYSWALYRNYSLPGWLTLPYPPYFLFCDVLYSIYLSLNLHTLHQFCDCRLVGVGIRL
jgi:hypothetical protein